MKKKALSLLLAALMLLSILPASFAEEVLDEVVVEDEVSENVDAQDPALSGGVVDFLNRLNDCKHVFQAIKADESGEVAANGISVKGTAANGAWTLSNVSPLFVSTKPDLTVTTIVLYFAPAMFGQLDKAAVEAALSASVSSKVEFSAIGNCAVINGSFCSETTIVNGSELSLPVVKVEVYTKEHFDENDDSYCDLCGGDTYTVVKRTTVNVSKTVDMIRRLSDRNETKSAEKTNDILSIIFGSVFTLFRVANGMNK